MTSKKHEITELDKSQYLNYQKKAEEFYKAMLQAEKSEYWNGIGFPVKKGEKTDNFIEKVDAQVAYIRDLVDMNRLEIVLSDF